MKVWDILQDKPEFIFERNVKLGVLQVINNSFFFLFFKYIKNILSLHELLKTEYV
jgi:hypothetical protein